ncbi:MAG: hypothetical protein CVU62_08300 [Deltaproteobacteria bacterium HGW-Deltaproteobacteria-2]|nr:MAG: hypothetical protein CVU62_08300 [Deltaproteobacteria bacterium HGW-Deltaproteobacteria-2]
MTMNYFDESIINALNGFSRVSEAFDYFMALLISNYLVKGGILMTILWWFWFWDKNDKKQNQPLRELKGKKQNQPVRECKEEKQNKLLRERIVLTLVACLIAIFLGRFLAYVLPFRLRPLQGMVNFIAPYGIDPNAFGSWSSFPSDHAVLFFALATGIFLISRMTGTLVTIYILLIICFPRVYCGLHYPTDIFAGALVGVGIGWLVITTKISKYISQPAILWLSKEPRSFYACFFLLTYQIATMFDPVREIGTFFMCLILPV